MISDPSSKTASIHLDYGADSADFDFGDLHICPHGLRLKTRWFFEPGTELSVNFQIGDPTGDGSAARMLRTEGVVAECERAAGGEEYEVTVYFLEVTEDILSVIRDVAGASVVLPG